ncbi:ABC transporter ATP-binding protein [Acidithiobacillus sulfurivorans]|uniref:ABC transporter ATP-binding protein n=1 Tax=Acidithiobacillus sulfurivorans TaxID=1958756 RepID=A0ABS5ZUL3_9PROT|nr:ABC transporter ATP-binding protein [Acidithiobacillus sulfurivorans]MBU2758758.1 ABC transporter ATP-binding protein [Acidithiobacillus sulfurivorans]
MNPSGQDTALLRCRSIGKLYGEAQILRDVSLDLYPAEIVALLGPNGAGKSTLLTCLVGLILANDGDIELFGQDIQQLDTQNRIQTGFVPQEFSGFSWMRVKQLLKLIAGFYPASGRHWKKLEDWADLDSSKKVQELSGGQRQRLAIVLAMRHRPRLLILDEPVSQLDPQARQDFLSLLQEHAREQEAAVLLSSHIVSDLERICSRFLVLHHGRIIAEWPRETLQPGEAESRFLAMTRDSN